jgi:hypothetical protein
MMADLPTHEIPFVTAPPNGSRESLPALAPFMLADGTCEAKYGTAVRLQASQTHLYIRFDCHDEDIWWTLTQRDDPLYDEEVVELFIAPGAENPVEYYEFEINPAGALFDARIHNPSGMNDAAMLIDERWDCDGIVWQASIDAAVALWSVELAIPWRSLCPDGALPQIWRANFYRIERPRGRAPEFSAWSPPLISPPDFHRPLCFGRLFLPVEVTP